MLSEEHVNAKSWKKITWGSNANVRNSYEV